MNIKALGLPSLAAIAVAALALLLSQGNGSPAGAKAGTPVLSKAGPAAVSIKGYAYAPVALMVKAGTKVTFTNHDQTAHTATADQGSSDTGSIAPGASSAIVFAHPGIYTYHCSFHAFMTGTVKVVR